MSKSLLKEYGVLFKEAMTSEFQDELAKFAADFLNVVLEGKASICHAVLDKLAEDMLEPDTVEAMVSVLDHLEETGTETESSLAKEASVKIANRLGTANLLLGTATAVAPVAAALRTRAVQNRQARENFLRIIRSNPSLQNDPNMSKYFNTIKNFSPEVARDPVILENTLRELQQMGPAALTVAKARDLAGLSLDTSKGRQYGVSPSDAIKEGLKNFEAVSSQAASPTAQQNPGTRTLADIDSEQESVNRLWKAKKLTDEQANEIGLNLAQQKANSMKARYGVS